MKMRDVPVLTFVEALRLIESNGFVEEIEDHMRNCTRQVVETSKPGTVTIVLKISPGNPNKQSSQVRIEEKVSSSVPRAAGSTIFFATETGDLSRENPEQGDLFGDKTKKQGSN